MQQCIGQHGDDAGNVGEEEQIDDENRQEGQYLPDDLADRVYYKFGDNKTERAAAAYADAVGSRKKGS